MPVLLFVAIKADQVRPEGRADRSGGGKKRRVDAGSFDGEADAVLLINGLRVADGGLPHGDNTRGAFKRERIGKGVGIAEGAPGLAGQHVLVLGIELAKAERRALVVPEEVEFEVPLDRSFTLVNGLAEFGKEPRWPRRYCRILGMGLVTGRE